jgi:hypothetical protein
VILIGGIGELCRVAEIPVPERMEQTMRALSIRMVLAIRILYRSSI